MIKNKAHKWIERKPGTYKYLPAKTSKDTGQQKHNHNQHHPTSKGINYKLANNNYDSKPNDFRMNNIYGPTVLNDNYNNYHVNYDSSSSDSEERYYKKKYSKIPYDEQRIYDNSYFGFNGYNDDRYYYDNYPQEYSKQIQNRTITQPKTHLQLQNRINSQKHYILSKNEQNLYKRYGNTSNTNLKTQTKTKTHRKNTRKSESFCSRQSCDICNKGKRVQPKPRSPRSVSYDSKYKSISISSGKNKRDIKLSSNLNQQSSETTYKSSSYSKNSNDCSCSRCKKKNIMNAKTKDRYLKKFGNKKIISRIDPSYNSDTDIKCEDPKCSSCYL